MFSKDVLETDRTRELIIRYLLNRISSCDESIESLSELDNPDSQLLNTAITLRNTLQSVLDYVSNIK